MGSRLCNKCKGNMFTCDVGVCACGGMLSSGSFKHCAVCADRLNQCQACTTQLLDIEQLLRDKRRTEEIRKRIINDDIVDGDGNPV